MSRHRGRIGTAITAITVLTVMAFGDGRGFETYSKGAAMIGVTAVTAAITVRAAGRAQIHA